MNINPKVSTKGHYWIEVKMPDPERTVCRSSNPDIVRAYCSAVVEGYKTRTNLHSRQKCNDL